MKEIKTISIKCDTKDNLELAQMTELQGKLKERTDIDYDKIKLSIIKFGFSFPFFVWRSESENKNYILDGHGRFGTLCKMQKDGYIIPPLPVVYIEADSKVQAKEKLLRLNSQYGHMTKESVLEFVGGEFELNPQEIALTDTTIDFSQENAVDLDDFFDEDTPCDKEENNLMTFTIKVYKTQGEEIKQLFEKNNLAYTVK